MGQVRLRVLGAGCQVLGAACWVLGAVAVAAAQPPARPPVPRLPILPLTQLDERQEAPDLDNRTFTVSLVQPTPMREVLLMLVRGTGLSIVPDPDVGGTFIGELKNVSVRRALDTLLPPFGLDYAVDGPVVHVFRRARETRLFDVNYLASTRTGAASIGTTPSPDGASYAQVATLTATDVFADIRRSVRTLLSDHATFSLDRSAGLLQVTDYPERLDRVANYLDAVQDRVHRQVQIDARILELELDADAPPSAPALRVADLDRFLADLAARGKVTTIAAPRLLSLNNEPAIVRGVDTAGTARTAVTLTVTPQIGDGIVTLSFSPIVSLSGSAAGTSHEPAAEREADTIARVVDGETLVISGFARSRETRERKVQGITGGWFGRSTVVTTKRIELLVLLTPRIVNPIGTQD